MQVKIEELLQQQYAEVKALIERRRDEVEAIAEDLIKRDELNSQDVEEILQRLRVRKASTSNADEPRSRDDTLLSNLLLAENDEWSEPAPATGERTGSAPPHAK